MKRPTPAYAVFAWGLRALAAQAALATLTVFTAQAETAPRLKQTVTLHPATSLIISGFSLSYERFIKPRLSLEVPFYGGLNDQLYDQARLFLGTGIGARFYLDEAQEGGYIAPLFEAVNMTLFSDKNADRMLEGGNVILTFTSLRYGYKFLWEYFTIDLGLSMGYFQSYGGSPDRADGKGIGVLTPIGHLALGLPF